MGAKGIRPELTGDIRQFARLVKEMRDAQWKYFRTRSFVWLNEAKGKEAEVDAVVKRILEGPVPETGNLFNGE
ncbi:MAG: hypothetical protein LUD50_00035 [Clostridia bacterium]|nr:hypothetical protein [Clostridia bacterium]